MLILRLVFIGVFAAFFGYGDGTINSNENIATYIKNENPVDQNIKDSNKDANEVKSENNENVATYVKDENPIDQNIVNYFNKDGKKDAKEMKNESSDCNSCKKPEPCKKCEEKPVCPPKVVKPCEPCKKPEPCKKCEEKPACPPKVEKPCEPCKKPEPCKKAEPCKKPEPCKKTCEPCKKKCCKPCDPNDPCRACKKPCDPCDPCKDPCRRIVDIEFKPAYFWPQDSVFRHIYHGGFIALGEVTFYVWRNYLTVFAEGGYFHKKGTIKEPDENVHTTVTQAPVTVGLGFNYPIYYWWDIYAKIGPNYVYTKTTQHSPFFTPKITKHCFGGTVGIGTKFNFLTYALLDIFVNYRYDRKEIHDSLSGTTFRRFLGGIDAGVGVGVRF
jgi:hypothetical protein